MDSGLMFAPCRGEPALFGTTDYLAFRWQGPGKILFSVTQKGGAAYCHFCSDRAGLRHVREAFEAFSQFVFWLFDWCEMIIATTKEKPSIERVLMKSGFRLVARREGATAYARCRKWA